MTRFICFFILLFYTRVVLLKIDSTSCRPGKLYQGVILSGGINAGKYIEGKDFIKEDECEAQCCDEPQCDVAFMLGNKCFLVICANISTCTMQLAKYSPLSPRLVYVTKWNAEGVKRTLFSDDQKPAWSPNICPQMVTLPRVTLRGGIKGGEFTDVGPVDTLQQCYGICCQQDSCDLAFLLAKNCFTVRCSKTQNRTKDLMNNCELEPAVESPFNPEAAHVLSRVSSPDTPSMDINSWNEQPAFSASASASPSSFSLFANKPLFQPSIFDAKQPQLFDNKLNPTIYSNPLPSLFQPPIQYPSSNVWMNPSPGQVPSVPLVENKKNQQATNTKDIMLGYYTIDPLKLTNYDLFLTPPPFAVAKIAETTRFHRISSETFDEECKLEPVLYNSSFKHGKGAGVFSKAARNVKDIKSCAYSCCNSKNDTFTCNVAFMVSETCYLVECVNEKMCVPTTTATTNYNPHMIYVREVNPPIYDSSLVHKTTPSTSNTASKITVDKNNMMLDNNSKTINDSKPSYHNSEEYVESSKSILCHHNEVLWNMTLEGATEYVENEPYSFSKTKYRKLLGKNVKSMLQCSQLCCDDSSCDAAVLQNEDCLSVTCSGNTRACMPVMIKPASNKETQLAFMTRLDLAHKSSGFPFKDNILVIGVSASVLLLVSIVVVVLIISTRRLRRGKKTIFKKKALRGTKPQVNKESNRAVNEDKEEEDKLEELLARASFSKNKNRRFG